MIANLTSMLFIFRTLSPQNDLKCNLPFTGKFRTLGGVHTEIQIFRNLKAREPGNFDTQMLSNFGTPVLRNFLLSLIFNRNSFRQYEEDVIFFCRTFFHWKFPI